MARTEAAKGKVGSAEIATWDTKNTLLPEFELSDLDGRKWSLADLKGKVAFINLWATWCGPCRAELPYVQKLREQLKDRKDVVVLTLNIDAIRGILPDMTFLLLLDPDEARERSGPPADRIEREGEDFLRAVDKAYRELGSIFAGRIVTIDASRPVDEVAKEVRDKLPGLS